MAVNYSHPVVCTADGRDDIVVGGTGMLDRLRSRRPASAAGSPRSLLRNIKTTPVVDGRHHLHLACKAAASPTSGSPRSIRPKTGNNDGKLDKAEIQAFVGKQPIPEAFFKKTFDRGDSNSDGFLEGPRARRGVSAPRQLRRRRLHVDSATNAADEFILAVRGGGKGDVTETHVALEAQDQAHRPHRLAARGRRPNAAASRKGASRTVFDTEARRIASRGRSGSATAAAISPRPCCGDGKIYLAGENGNVVVLKNAADYEELAGNDVGDSHRRHARHRRWPPVHSHPDEAVLREREEERQVAYGN